jgi:protein-disulfide isomerase
MSDSRRRIYQAGALLVSTVAVLGVVIAVLTSSGAQPLKPGKPVPGTKASIDLFAGIPQSATRLGYPNAPITMVEFGDLQCPYCAWFADHTLPTLVSRYVREGHLQLLFAGLDGLGHDSRRAAQMADALARQNHLWQFVDLAYRNQGDENSGYVTDDFLRAIAGVIPGVDVQRAMTERSSAAVSEQIAATMEMAHRLRLVVTPSFQLFYTGKPPRRFSPQSLESDSFTGTLQRMLTSG